MQDSGRLAFQLTPDPAAPRRARELVARCLDGTLTPARVDDTVLLVSEVVTNAVLHAGLEERDWIHLSVAVTAEAVRVDVRDSGSGFAARSGVEPPTPESLGGRGLFLVEELSDRSGIAPDGSSRVWFELDR